MKWSCYDHPKLAKNEEKNLSLPRVRVLDATTAEYLLQDLQADSRKQNDKKELRAEGGIKWKNTLSSR